MTQEAKDLILWMCKDLVNFPKVSRQIAGYCYGHAIHGNFSLCTPLESKKEIVDKVLFILGSLSE